MFANFRGNLEGKRNLQSYKELLKNPQLKYSGLYQRYFGYSLENT